VIEFPDEGDIHVEYTWQEGPLGLEICAHGKDDNVKQGIMLQGTPGFPFPPTVTAGMIIETLNGTDLTKMSFTQALTAIKAAAGRGFPLTMSFGTDISAHLVFQPYIREASEVFSKLADPTGKEPVDLLSMDELRVAMKDGVAGEAGGAGVIFDSMDVSGDGQVHLKEWLNYCCMQVTKKGEEGDEWIEALLARLTGYIDTAAARAAQEDGGSDADSNSSHSSSSHSSHRHSASTVSDGEDFVSHSWKRGPLGIDLAPHGEDEDVEEGIMLTKTPGPPFPPTVTAGMLIAACNGTDITAMSFRKGLAFILEQGFPLKLRFQTDVTAHENFGPFVEEATEAFQMLAGRNGHEDLDTLSIEELVAANHGDALSFDSMDTTGDGEVELKEWLSYLCMHVTKKQKLGPAWLEGLLNSLRTVESNYSTYVHIW